MIPVTGGVRIFLYRGGTDLRRGFDGLSGLVRTHFGSELFSGALFVFVNRRRRYLKLLYWDRDGFAIWAKRLERGTFRVPAAASDRIELSPADMVMLLEGITPLRISRRYCREAAAS